MPIAAPTDIANCQLYLDADVGVFSDAGTTPCAVGDAVRQWNDQSVNGRNAGQATSGDRPLYVEVAGVGAIRFVSTDFLDTASFLSSAYDTAATFVVVWEPTTPAFATGIGVVSDGTFFGGVNTSSNVEIATWNSALGNPTVNLTRRNARAEIFRYNGSTRKLRAAGPDGDSEDSTADTGNLSVSGAVRVGAFGTGGFGWPGLIRAVVVYSRSLTDGECDDLRAWANTRFHTWAAGSLSSGGGDVNIVCDGNSLTAGEGATAGQSYPSQLLASLGAGYAIANEGISSQRTGHMLHDTFRTWNTVDDQWDAGAAKNVCVAWEGINDLANGGSGSQAFQRLKEYGLRRKAKGWQVIVLTTIEWGTATGTQETERQALNTLLLANWADFADALVDVAADPAFDDPSDTTYYNADTIHLTDAGYAVVAGLVQTAVSGLPAGGGKNLAMRRMGGVEHCSRRVIGVSGVHIW